MRERYVRRYTPGAVTTAGFVVICVPGMKPIEVTEVLADRLTDLIVRKKISEAQTLLSWFAGEEDVSAK